MRFFLSGISVFIDFIMLIFDSVNRIVFMNTSVKNNLLVFDFNFIPNSYGIGKSSISEIVKKALKIVEFQVAVFRPFYTENLSLKSFSL